MPTFVLDTNVVSEVMRPHPSSAVVDWLDRQAPSTLYLSAVSEAELRYGIETLPAGRRRERLRSALEAVLQEEFAGRIIPFDTSAARAYAAVGAARRAAGQPISHADCQIAAIAHSRGAWVVTRDVAGFEGCGVEVVNPWAGE